MPSKSTVLLQTAGVFVFAYLCLGEFLPKPLAKGVFEIDWARQEVLLLAALSFLAVLLASVGGCSGIGLAPGAYGRPSAACSLLAALNVVPIVVTLITQLFLLTKVT